MNVSMITRHYLPLARSEPYISVSPERSVNAMIEVTSASNCSSDISENSKLYSWNATVFLLLYRVDGLIPMILEIDFQLKPSSLKVSTCSGEMYTVGLPGEFCDNLGALKRWNPVWSWGSGTHPCNVVTLSWKSFRKVRKWFSSERQRLYASLSVFWKVSSKTFITEEWFSISCRRYSALFKSCVPCCA